MGKKTTERNLVTRNTEVTSEVNYANLDSVIKFLQECRDKYGEKAFISLDTEYDYGGQRAIINLSWQEQETDKEYETRVNFQKERVNAEKALYESLKKKYEKDA